jgi:hypothetical protein
MEELYLSSPMPSGSYRARSTAQGARSITVISMGSVLLPADLSSSRGHSSAPGPGAVLNREKATGIESQTVTILIFLQYHYPCAD